jgi:predicted PolB exonuclease-like 3'-5' exonuclease
MAQQKVRYFVFDTESVADGNLVARIRYPGQDLKPAEATAKYRADMFAKYDSDFIPYTYQMPISVAIGKVNADFELLEIVVLDDPLFRPHVITENFWRGWLKYQKPTLVSFNGRTFDIPLLELAAFRYGISVPDWFSIGEKAYDQRRNRYNHNSHLDLQELFTNFGATRLSGGLNLFANLLGKPGKMNIAGHMVQELFEQGELRKINDYCRCDVLDTYFVFLRSAVMLGQITIEREQQLVQLTRQYLEEQAEQIPAYTEYLSAWGEWRNPWKAEAEKQEEGVTAESVESAEGGESEEVGSGNTELGMGNVS